MSGRQAVWTCLHLRAVLKRAKAHGEGTNIPLCGIENSYRFGNKHISAVQGAPRLVGNRRVMLGAVGPCRVRVLERLPNATPYVWPNLSKRFSFLSVSLGQHPELPAGFTPSPSGYSGTVLPSSTLPHWSAAKTLMMQSNKSTRPALY